MKLYSNQNSKPFFFINHAIMEKNNHKKMYVGTHVKDYNDSNDHQYPNHVDIVHENMHENTSAGYVDINEKYCNNW